MKIKIQKQKNNKIKKKNSDFKYTVELIKELLDIKTEGNTEKIESKKKDYSTEKNTLVFLYNINFFKYIKIYIFYNKKNL